MTPPDHWPSSSDGARRSEDESRALDDLVFACMEALEEGGPSALEARLAQHPAQASELRGRLEMLRACGLLSVEQAPVAPAFPERLGDFDLIELLGEGGMGVVYRARQFSLEREVALKLIRPEHLFFAGARERFRREVAVIAKLQHPGIVPVYSVGEQDGLPYFAMELVSGCTLRAVMDDLARCDRDKLVGADLWRAILRRAPVSSEVAGDGALPELFQGSLTQASVRILRQVATALQHAHSRGVAHRDLKPSNIMLTPNGRVMLFDFGLAGSSSSPRITRTGVFMGSLGYAPPERLRGKSPEFDVTGDVYSLGVTLYELLALALPFCGSTDIELRAAVLAGHATPLRQQGVRVSKDLETICAVAMADESARRYASAGEFEGDLQRWAESRPIAARRSPWPLRARRWVVRHPSWAVGALALLLLACGGPLLWGLQRRSLAGAIASKDSELGRARQGEQAARDAAALEQQAAERNFWRGVESVEGRLSRVAQLDLEEVPGISALRLELQREALTRYTKFARERPGNARIVLGRARLEMELGRMQAYLGENAAALASWGAARAALLQIECTPEFRAAAGDELLTLLVWMGLRLGVLGDYGAARQVLEEACMRFERGLSSAGWERKAALRACNAYDLLGAACVERGDLMEAETLLLRALELGGRCAALEGPGAAGRAELTDVLGSLAMLHTARGQVVRAKLGLQTALDLSAEVVELEPTKTNRRRLAKALTGFVAFADVHARELDTFAVKQRCADVAAALHGDYPQIEGFLGDYVIALLNLSGGQMEQRDDYAAAGQTLEQAQSLLKEWQQRHPAGRAQRFASSVLLRCQGFWHFGSGEFEASDDHYRRALEVLEGLLREFPRDRELLQERRQWRAARAEVLLAAGFAERASEATRIYLDGDAGDPSVQLWSARYFARAAKLAAENWADDERRFEFIDRCTGDAFECLEFAARNSGINAAALRRESGFSLLREDPYFEELLSLSQ